jgi:hypothetical protein
MAIPFLNNINLSDNQLQNAKLHITGTAPTAAAAQIYFDSSDTIAKYYSNATDTWISLVQTDFADGTFVSLTNGGTSIKRAYTVDLSAVDGSSTSASRFLTKDNTWATIPFGDVTEVQGGTYINVTDQTGPIPIVNHDLTTRTDTTSTAAPAYGATFTAIDSVTTNTTGHITALNVKTITIPASDDTTYDLLTAPTGTAIRLDPSTGTNDDVTISGTTGQTAMSRISASELRVALTDDVTIVDDLTVGGELTVSGTGQSSVAGQLTIPQVPSADTDAASKHYVDQAVTGALSYQGGYNAATNTPDLDSSPSSAIKKGWTYTVTADGLFFTEQVRVGDVLIAENNAPTTLAEWTTVQNNVDLADLTTVGIGNVVPGEAMNVAYSNGTATVSVEKSSATNMGAVIVKGADPINVTYDTSGNATVGIEDSAAAQKGAVIVAGGTGISVAYSNGTATVTNTETNADNSYAETITDTDLTIDHNLGTKDVIVQLYDVTTDETVYADVERISTSRIGVTFAATPTNSVRVLVQKIG